MPREEGNEPAQEERKASMDVREGERMSFTGLFVSPLFLAPVATKLRLG